MTRFKAATPNLCTASRFNVLALLLLIPCIPRPICVAQDNEETPPPEVKAVELRLSPEDGVPLNSLLHVTVILKDADDAEIDPKKQDFDKYEIKVVSKNEDVLGPALRVPGGKGQTWTLRAKQADRTGVKLSATAKLKTSNQEPANTETDSIPVKPIEPSRVADVTVEIFPPKAILVNTEFGVRVRLTGENGATIPPSDYGQYRIELTSDNANVVDQPQKIESGFEWKARAIATGRATLTASAKRIGELGQNDEAVAGRLVIEPLRVIGFQPLTVALDIMDSTMARYLFGRKISDEFHVLRVRLFNNLGKVEGGELVGSSVLAYSESIEVAVTFEKKRDPKSNSRFDPVQDPAEGQWSRVQLADVLDQFSPPLMNDENVRLPDFLGTQSNQTQTDDPAVPTRTSHPSRTFTEQRGQAVASPAAGQPSPTQAGVRKYTIYDAPPATSLRDTLVPLAARQRVVEKRDSTREEFDYIRHRFRFRPYSYEMMANTVDPRDAGTTRTKLFRILGLTGTIASAITAIPGNSGLLGSPEQTAVILEKYSAIAVPSLQAAWPSLKETERQNLLTHAMRQIEEIPFASDLSRVLFIPRRPFRGFLPGHLARIGEVHTNYFNIKVAIVSKTNTATIDAAVQPRLE